MDEPNNTETKSSPPPAQPTLTTPPLPTLPPPPSADRATIDPITPIAIEPAIADRPTDNTSRGTLQRLADGFGSTLGFIFSWFVFPILIVLILHNFVFQAYHVVGTSMVNTLQQNDYLIVSKLGYSKALIGEKTGHKATYIPGRGQVVVFHYPKQPDLVFVKRVVALAGERVTVKNGKVTVYNKTSPGGFEPDAIGKYLAENTATQGDVDETVAADSIFVLGDNRSPGGSFDSREWGDLPSSYIIGNAVLRLLPIDKITSF